MPYGGSVVNLREVTPYEGPGDILSQQATAWWGLRAYSSAKIGSNAIRLRRSSDNDEEDFVTVAGGGLDVTAINLWASGTIFVVYIYDQAPSPTVGDQHQGNSAFQLKFQVAGGPGGLPAIVGETTGDRGMSTDANYTVLSPLTFNFLGSFSNAVAGFQGFIGQPGIIMGANLDNAGSATTDRIFIRSTAPRGVTQSAGTYSMTGCFEDGVQWNLTINGTDNSLTTPGNVDGTNAQIAWCGFGDDTPVGAQLEGAIWNDIFLGSTDRAALATNQQDFWGV